MEIYIEDWHPITLNKLMAIHWGSRTKRKQKDYAVIAAYARQVQKATTKRRVELEIGLSKGQRSPDVDAHAKVVLDALVKCGMIINDSPLHCEYAPVQFTRGKKYTRIKLIDIN